MMLSSLTSGEMVIIFLICLGATLLGSMVEKYLDGFFGISERRKKNDGKD